MTPESLPPRSGQPPLGQMFAQFLKDRAMRSDEPAWDWEGPPGEVIPHQAASAAVVEPRAALEEAVEAAAYLTAASRPREIKGLQKVPEWGTVVRSAESTFAIPFALGNYPQQLRNLAPLFHAEVFSSLRSAGEKLLPISGVAEWGKRQAADGKWEAALVAVGMLRTARQFAPAETLLTAIQAAAPASVQGLIANEQAALAWQRGDCELAVKLWESHPQADSPAILFNRGMAALFMDQREAAAQALAQAVEALPESSAWHHLARLYLTLAEQGE